MNDITKKLEREAEHHEMLARMHASKVLKCKQTAKEMLELANELKVSQWQSDDDGTEVR